MPNEPKPVSAKTHSLLKIVGFGSVAVPHGTPLADVHEAILKDKKHVEPETPIVPDETDIRNTAGDVHMGTLGADKNGLFVLYTDGTVLQVFKKCDEEGHAPPTKKQADAVKKLAVKLEHEGADPTVLDLGKSWEELTPAQQEFLKEICKQKAEPDAEKKP
jgi:hypothetical protein